MNDTKVQRYEVVSSAYGYFLGMRTELAAAHLENKRLTSLLAKYQRLHAADVGYDESSKNGTEHYMRFLEERRLAMEALATHPQEPTK